MFKGDDNIFKVENENDFLRRNEKYNFNLMIYHMLMFFKNPKDFFVDVCARKCVQMLVVGKLSCCYSVLFRYIDFVFILF